MTLQVEARASDSPYIDTITHGFSLSKGSAIRPAEFNWHMVITRHGGGTQCIIAGPWSEAGFAAWGAGAEILWVRFKPGTYMPHMPTRDLLNREIILPDAASKSFWLYGSAWQFPDHENVDTFVDRLIGAEILVRDSVVAATLQAKPHDLASRTVRDRFLRATGQTLNHIRQVEHAQRAAAMLDSGASILDTVFENGYFDQPHLTRSLKRFIGLTPAQLIRISNCTCDETSTIEPLPEDVLHELSAS